MPIDDTLARWSDISFETAFVVYLLAAILFIAQLATTRTATLSRAASLHPQLIAATSSTPGYVPVPERRAPSERLGRTGLALVMLALTLHVGSIVLRGIATVENSAPLRVLDLAALYESERMQVFQRQ